MAGSPKGNEKSGMKGERWILEPLEKPGAKAQRARWRGDSNQMRTETSEERRVTSGVTLGMQRQWWGGRPPRLMFEPRWNK